MTKIMLVEDDKSLREIYGVRLMAEGYEIISAGDGEVALAMAVKEKPDLILSDVMMPKISGFDMLDILRSTPETKDVKVIMMTALSSEDQRTRGESLGANRYLVKSQVGIEDVVRAVGEVLNSTPVPATNDIPAVAVETQETPQSTSTMPPVPVINTTQPAESQYASTLAPAEPVMQPQPSVEQSTTPPPAPIAPIVESIQLPQPTAPFSTPAPASLGDRIINPITPTTAPVDMEAMMSKELLNDGSTTSPQQPPQF